MILNLVAVLLLLLPSFSLANSDQNCTAMGLLPCEDRCMRVNYLCCNDGKGRSCPSGLACIPEGCCPIGGTCVYGSSVSSITPTFTGTIPASLTATATLTAPTSTVTSPPTANPSRAATSSPSTGGAPCGHTVGSSVFAQVVIAAGNMFLWLL